MSEEFADHPTSETADAPDPAPEEDDHPAIPEVTDQTVEIDGMDHFDSLIEVHDVVLTEVYGDWCDVCDMMEPFIEELAGRDGLVVATINIAENEPLCKEMGVQKVPTYTLFVEAEPVEQAAGARDREWFNDLLADAV